MAYSLSNGHVTNDVTWPHKVPWGSTVGYPSNSLASCLACDSIYAVCGIWCRPAVCPSHVWIVKNDWS